MLENTRNRKSKFFPFQQSKNKKNRFTELGERTNQSFDEKSIKSFDKMDISCVNFLEIFASKNKLKMEHTLSFAYLLVLWLQKYFCHEIWTLGVVFHLLFKFFVYSRKSFVDFVLNFNFQHIWNLHVLFSLICSFSGFRNTFVMKFGL